MVVKIDSIEKTAPRNGPVPTAPSPSGENRPPSEVAPEILAEEAWGNEPYGNNEPYEHYEPYGEKHTKQHKMRAITPSEARRKESREAASPD